ncbi:acetyl-CoA carboxylase biotin carboxylase subunit [Afifella marina]|uniref:propionyl-CoA carboxylase n=1 Tax=Afifella marina DSM 2698 TaxID=1120955 RepID=A0A1G5NJZ6_AFIMA|nr:acetyl/propionyl/methylcrotonyl-CoA carboxylase subunit alpha [Afifella marina]MBK1623542.1 acetyl/propionyl/methylcrotonyl-CoA carboxylase subunit alpha [Afifella marina DSM 2698]MBK1626535.1 acetyl/propionyl/methylcrotonyl-CoA carboxylase subunit alpha [Afifella marina]MBK5916084.1 acetyl/propionyl-CoA carboxylase subunit alpha [Afifella marina]RAI21711.1 acetyl/propionyl-CoA carboxylase subunit alpha [Afifella marina DSM 2698]SCZ37069.1 propionyl-CoA carboxylase alpha chain [Afifella mar
MFRKILIANRGEIACRIIRSAQKMGIATVAVYSEADRNALHVEMADEKVAIGPAPASESYLKLDKIIEACRQTGAEAVHPGYGFLSENANFAKALAEAGIVFIGPPIGAIEAMGDKITSKKVAKEAGVSVVPGHMGLIESGDEAVRISAEIGLPVMLKASAGGGGKGMRVAWNEQEVREGFDLARREAKSSFGDERIFIEKFVEQPRHIEIQVLADKHGNVIHLGERECSIQRRNQKVIEEAPSSFLDPETRAAMGAQACALAAAVGYETAGTVEFIVDRDRNFYFLEMNTRLQVEHPVTELVTGLDLVELMIRVADGEKLPLAQEDVVLKGWAIEARLYAEDPFRGFLPSTGRLRRYRPPEDAAHEGTIIRNDTGVVEGSEITLFYDPMIAKLCTYAEGEGTAAREKAIDVMSDALDAFTITGIRNNIAFLSGLMAHPRFRRGDLSTAFIAEEYGKSFEGADATDEDLRILAAIATCVQLIERVRLDDLSGRLRPHPGTIRPDWVVLIDGEAVDITITSGMPSIPFDVEMIVDGIEHRVVTAWKPGDLLWHGIVDDKEVFAQIERRGAALRVERRGVARMTQLLRPSVGQIYRHMPEKAVSELDNRLACPMPGIVVSLPVEEGQKVEAGETLATVEAMKMENVLRAERDVVIKKICAAPGDVVAFDQVLIEFE